MAVPARCVSGRVEVALVVGGRWHDMDFARRRAARRCSASTTRAVTSVHQDFSDIGGLAAADAVVAYTCDVRPTAAQAASLREMVEAGGPAARPARDQLRHRRPGGGAAAGVPDSGRHAGVRGAAGNRFLAHPKIAPFTDRGGRRRSIRSSPASEHFVTTDEIYVSELGDDLDGAARRRRTGPVPGVRDRPRADGPPASGAVHAAAGHRHGHLLHPRALPRALRHRGPGHRRPGVLDRVAWESPQYREVLRRCMAWAVHGNGWPECPASRDQEQPVGSKEEAP